MAEAILDSHWVPAPLPPTYPTCLALIGSTHATLLALLEVLAVFVVPNIRRCVEPELT